MLATLLLTCTWFCSDTPTWKLSDQAVILPLYTYQGLVLHEASHLIVGSLAGLKVESFKPYPCKTKYYDRQVLAKVSFTDHAEGRADGWVALSPVMLDVTMFALSDILLNTTIDKHSKVAPYVWAAGMLLPLADMIMFTVGQNRFSDIAVTSRQLGINRTALTFIAGSVVAVMLYRIIDNGIGIF
jgi:hypothetical protein